MEMCPKKFIKCGGLVINIYTTKAYDFSYALKIGGDYLELYSVYQPIIQLNNQTVLGYESLLRGNDSPLKLFEHASKTGEIVNLDSQARELALSAFNSVGKLFINVHPKSLEEDFEIDYKRYNVDPHNIVIELTEHDQLTGNKFRDNIEDIKRLGLKIALDDFGHGFTNLKLIEIIQPDYIKLDKSLIENITARSVKPLLKGLRGIATDIGAELIAEGIETKEQLHLVEYCDIKYGQGWLLGRPVQFTKEAAIK